MAFATFNTKSPTIKRILKEASELSAHPDPTLHAAPLESNLFEWHFTIKGPPGTPYAAGAYHGRIILPPTYPLRPPSFRFLTPSGRFEVNREICLSISGHHEETWQPAWGIRTALYALRAFMEGDAKGQVGGMEMPEKERFRLAEESRSWKCSGCGERANEVILQDEGGGGIGEGKPAEVPEDLRFGFKDELGKGKDKGKGKEITEVSPSQGIQSSTDTQTPTEILKTGSVHPDVLATAADVLPSSSDSLLAPRDVPMQPVTTRLNQSMGSPAWLDKAITGIAAALALMIIKKIIL